MPELAATLGLDRFPSEIEKPGVPCRWFAAFRSRHGRPAEALRAQGCRTRRPTALLPRRPAAICAALLTVAAGRLGAQDVSIGGRLGLVGGFVWFQDEEANDMNRPRAGFQIGGVVAYRPRSILSMQAELWYVQKGWTETQGGGGRRLTYVELPLLLAVTPRWKTAPQLLVGASASLELGCAVTGVRGVGSVSCDDPQVEWHRTKAQFAAWLGLGVRRRMGSNQLAVQLLAGLNLTNLNRELQPPGAVRLLSATVSVAYVIALGGTAR
ncbi:MAG: PorT family protein [Gemmatimonadota bacterium]|nr:PorT family protein [Gemmatimonadota bacterium]